MVRPKGQKEVHMSQVAKTVEEKGAKKLEDAKKKLARYTFGANDPVVKAGTHKAGECRCDLATVRYEPSVNKNSVEIISIFSGARRRVYTSDVFQLFGTEQEMKDAKKAAKEASKKEEAEALALYRQQQGQ
jgi:sirohydrochlorin ferrochelatase